MSWLALLLIGAAVRAVVYFLVPVPQWVHDFYRQNAVQQSVTMAVAFCWNRFPVGLALGLMVATARILRYPKPWTVLVGILIPTLFEVALSVPILPEWYPLGSYQMYMLTGLLLTPLTAGLVISLVATAKMASDASCRLVHERTRRRSSTWRLESNSRV